MTTREKMATGRLYSDQGDGLPEELERCKELVYEYNSTRPGEKQRRLALLRTIFGHIGQGPYIEPPMHLAYGTHTHIGDFFYANFNLVIVDDIDVFIGDNVMCAPNVTISATGHPVHPALREHGEQFSFPVHIGSRVWLGAGAIILPGITIGENLVIGAGSVVTRDIPANVVAVGNPCRVLRPITERDREYYCRDLQVEAD